MSMTVTAEAEKLALSHVPAGTEIGGGSSVACGKWPVEDMDAIPMGVHQLLRTPANANAATLRKRAQESAGRKAAGLAAASLASLDVLAASTGRSAELAAAGEMQQQPDQTGSHGDSQAPPSSSEQGENETPLYPVLPNRDELEDQEGQELASGLGPRRADEVDDRQERLLGGNGFDHSINDDDEDDVDDDDDSVGMDVDDDQELSDGNDDTYYPVPNVDRYVTDRRTTRSLHFPNRDLGQIDVLAEPRLEEHGIGTVDPNVAIEAALMGAQRDSGGHFVIPKDPMGMQRPVPPHVVTTAGRAQATNRGRTAGRGSTTKRAHAGGDAPGGKARRGQGPSGPSPPGGNGGSGGGNGGNPQPPSGPPQPPSGGNGHGGGSGDPGGDPSGGGNGANGSGTGRGDAFADLAHRYRKSIPAKLYEIPELSDLNDLQFVSWLQKGKCNIII